MNIVKRVRNKLKKGLTTGQIMFLVLLPSIIWVGLMNYKPMWGLLYAFYEYKPRVPILECEFVGLRYYKMLVQNPIQRREFWQAVRNTLIPAAIGYATSYVTMFVALFLNEIRIKWYQRMVQTIITIPHFLSWVVVYSSLYAILAPNSGIIATTLRNWGIIENSFNFLTDAKYGYLLRWIMEHWHGTGWGTIIFLAALSAVDTELYDAAEVDGAGRFQKMFHVSLPCIWPTYIVTLIMSVGNIFNTGIDFPRVFSNDLNRTTLETVDYYTYRVGLVGLNVSVGTAVGLAKSVIGLILMFSTNAIAKKVRGAGIM